MSLTFQNPTEDSFQDGSNTPRGAVLDGLGPGARHHLHPALHYPHSLQDLDQTGGQKTSGNHHQKAERRVSQTCLKTLTSDFVIFLVSTNDP